MQFINDYETDGLNLAKATSAAIQLSHESKMESAVIKVHGEGYAVVGNGWALDRNYYHGEGGKKMFFDVVAKYNCPVS